jgi:hypothetical protein
MLDDGTLYGFGEVGMMVCDVSGLFALFDASATKRG